MNRRLELTFGHWMVIVSVALFAVTILFDPHDATLHLGLLGVLSVALPVAILSAVYHEVNYSALKFIFAFFVMVGPGRHLYFTLFVDRFTSDWFYIAQTQAGFIYSATWTVVFNSMIALGYAMNGLIKPRVLPKALPITSSTRAGPLELHLKLGLCLLAVFGAYMSLEASGGFRLFTSQKSAVIMDGQRFAMGHWLSMTRPISFVYVLCFLRIVTGTRGRYEWPIFLFAILFSVWWGYVRSVRGEILVALVTLLFTYYVVRNRISLVQGMVAGGAALVFVAVMTQIRQMGRAGGEVTFSVGKVLEPLFGEYNLGGFVALKQVMALVPEALPHANGVTFVQFLWMFIPRTVWRDKPLAVGEYLLSGVSGLTTVRQGGGAAAALIGESFLNFGHVGLIVIPMLFGILLWYIDRMTLAFANRTVGLAVMICLVIAATYSSFGYYFAKGVLDALLTTLPAVALIPLAWRDTQRRPAVRGASGTY